MNKLTLSACGALLLVSSVAVGQQVIRPNGDGSYRIEGSPPSSSNEWQFLRDAGRNSFADLGQALGRDLMPNVRPTAIILTVKCSTYVDGTVVYSNGSYKTVAIGDLGVPASDSNLAAIRTAARGVAVSALDLGC